jgi:hypothetical protein
MDLIASGLQEEYGTVSQVRAWPISESGQNQDVKAIQDAGEGHDKDKDIGTDEDSGLR